MPKQYLITGTDGHKNAHLQFYSNEVHFWVDGDDEIVVFSPEEAEQLYQAIGDTLKTKRTLYFDTGEPARVQ
jgi:hypothetical protein